MNNRSPKILWSVDYSSMTSITHWCNWLLIDDPSMTRRLLYCSQKTKDIFLAFLYYWFSFVILLSLFDAFFLVSEVLVDHHVETQNANQKYRRFSAVQCFTLPNSLLNNKTTEQYLTNQSENESNKYADKNRLYGYRFFFVGVCQQSKTASD